MKHYLLVHNRKVGDTGTLPVSGKIALINIVTEQEQMLTNDNFTPAHLLRIRRIQSL